MGQISVIANRNDADWLEVRKDYIGASEIAAAAGIHPFRTPFSLWSEKVGLSEPFAGNESTEWGNRLEPAVFAKWCEITGNHDMRLNDHTFTNSSYPRMSATPDAIIAAHRPRPHFLEIKTTSLRQKSAWAEGVPDYVQLQCQQQMLVLGIGSWCDLAVLIGGQQYEQFRVEYDAEIAEKLVKIAAEFWERVDKKQPPELSEGDKDLVKLLYPEGRDEVAALPDNAKEWAALWFELKEQKKELERKLDRVETQFKGMLAECESGVVGDYVVNWKTSYSTRLDTKAIKNFHPLVAEQCTVVSPQRRFGIKKLEEKDG